MRTYPIPALLALTLACTANAPAGSSAAPGLDTASVDSATLDTASADDAAAPLDAPADGPDAVKADATTADAADGLPLTFGLQLAPVPLPAFSKVVNSDTTPITAEDLLGHYTVVWFYPAAQTSG